MSSSPCFSRNGPVDQLGMIAAFATRKPRVQIPPGPPLDLNLSGSGYLPIDFKFKTHRDLYQIRVESDGIRESKSALVNTNHLKLS